MIADELNQAVLIKLRGKCLGDAIDSNQLGGPFADLVLSLVDDQVCARIVECDGGIRGEVFKQAKMLLGVRVLFEALNAEHSKYTFLRDQGQIDHRSGRLRHTAVDECPTRMFVGCDVLRELCRNVVEQNRLAIVNTPDRELIFVVGTPRIRRITLAVFDRKAVFDQVPLRPV